MKKIIFIFIFINLLYCSNLYPYWTNIHSYLVDEAWKLVRLQHPEVINSEMDLHIGPAYNSTPPVFTTGHVTAGAYLEDVVDFLYINSVFLLSCIPVGGSWTSTHFWDADEGDNDHWYIIPAVCGYANSYQKIRGQYYGINQDGVRPWYGYPALPLLCSNGSHIWAELKYNDITDFIKNPNNVKTSRYMDFAGYWHYLDPNGTITDLLLDQIIMEPWFETEAQVHAHLKTIMWEVIGRVCHDIQDGGVPAHVHNDIHDNNDYYEKTYFENHNYASKGFMDAYNEGGLIDINNLQNPLRSLHYVINQLSDRFPSNDADGDNNYTINMGNQDIAFINGQLSPKYDAINYIQVPTLKLNDPSYTIDTRQGVLSAIFTYTYVYNIRAIAGFLWYVYNRIYPPPPPVITNITSNMIGSQQYGYTLFKGKTGALYSTVQGTPVNYTWTLYECNTNSGPIWSYSNNGIYTQSSPSSPHFVLRNHNYAGQSCTIGDRVPSALHFFTKLRAYNNSGEYWSDLFRINPSVNLAGGGCPYIFVLGNDTSGGKYFTENNILHRSEFSENANQSITDVYKLNTVPKIDSNKITLQIMETENDVNYFDQIKLFAVDHPAGSKIGITESNDIVMYYSEDVSSSDYATQNFSSYNIAPYIQYGQPTPKITGVSNDFVNSHYDSTSQYAKLKYYKNRLKAKGYKGSSDSLALIGEIGSDVMVPIQPSVKDWAGSISIYTNSDTYIKPFSKRVNVSDVIIPFAQTEDIVDNIDINFNSDYAMSYFSVVPVFYEGFTKTELNLLNAVHAVNGDVLSSLIEIDNEFADMDTTAIIDLKFESIIPPDQSMVRDYVFVVNGLYTSEYGYNKNQPFRLTSNNSIKPENIAYKYRLNTNYPNPFNPKTKISYSLAKSGITRLAVYDVLGRLMNVLVNEYKSSGEYTVEFNGSHLSSGVYIYRLESNDFTDTKRMLLIK